MTARHVLIIDDDEIVRVLLHHIFIDLGFKVSRAKDGWVGLKKLKEKTFDLVVTDIYMPRADGIEVVKTITRQATRPKIIVITGGSDFLDSQFALKTLRHLGADCILNKPLTKNRIVTAIQEICRHD
ncbi:MAG: response regulator [Magnetococcales bacterium]|nr:response regulator [Magnetococcales bacterium]